ncbi:Vesicle transport protein, Got1/SFT2-like [Aspergillus oryzae]|uniref:Protein transport protein SFT2 n=1 Tax=Aspergillus oryzae TaxID=5062 RepID=A0A1S9DR37_ASPOZ|nr:Vesicle transport protein, Got1/SFT2-like [Aspergillus oryzae]RAQ46634.1 SFT2 domain protein [Aspergillus flavus]
MATTSFRDSVNSLGWSRRDPDVPVRTNASSTSFLSRLQSWNPLGQGEGYVQLPTHEAPGAPLPAASRREEEDNFFAFLMGPLVYAKHLVSGPRLPFTAAYFGAIAMTLYFAVGRHNTFLTLISSIFQLAALIWYLVSYFPMGSTGLQFMGRFGAQRVTTWMTS